VGQIATFVVSKVEDGGLEVKYQDKITTYIKRNELSKDKVECRPERFALNDKVDAKVVAYDKASNSYRVSIKAKEQDEERSIIAEYGSVDSGASLGDILGVALDKNKKK
jgi:small subunit ribosomal protein S1